MVWAARQKRLVFTLLATGVLVQPVLADTLTVADNAVSLAVAGSATNPTEWILDHETTTNAAEIQVGGADIHDNRLTVDSRYSFSAQGDFRLGPVHSSSNRLNVVQGGQMRVQGNLYNGTGSIMYYSQHNQVNVAGTGSVLRIGGGLDMSAGYNATGNTLRISDGGLVTVEGTFELYYHWAYGNNWLDLAGGNLLLNGDVEESFASGNGVLSSIRVWDDVSGDFQRLAYYNSTTLIENSQYMDMFMVQYLGSEAEAAALGLSGYAGYTVLRNTAGVNPVPEPATLLLFGVGVAGMAGLRRQRRVC